MAVRGLDFVGEERRPGGEGPEVVIVGSGFAGLCMAVRLKAAGRHDFVVLEKADEVGGVWRENTYPGCACDVVSALYSYSFAPNPEWDWMFARQPDIHDYLKRVVRDYELGPHIRLGSEVVAYDFDESTDRWQVRTATGDVYHPRIVVSGVGQLHDPRIPDFPGRDRFAGHAFHSAEWDHSLDLRGARVAVIGTGSSAVQFAPAIAKSAAHLTVFQRTPYWIMPRVDRPVSAAMKWLYRTVPGAQKALRLSAYWGYESVIAGFMHPRLMKVMEWMARALLRLQVKDAELRAELTPDYTMGCKRILVSSDYYPMLQQPNVDLVTSGIAEFTETGIRTEDGVVHEVDVIVYGTGFAVRDRFESEHRIGRLGLSIQDAWRDGMSAYLGIAVAGFPNSFLMLGPNSGGGNQSLVFVIEAQSRYIVKCLELMDERQATRIEVRADIQRDLDRVLQSKLEGSVWVSGGCKSWYLDTNGRNHAAWPGTSISYWRATRRPDAAAFELSALDARMVGNP